MMETAHEIVVSFTADHAIDMHDFWEWFRDGDYTEDEANIHETRFLCLLEQYVQEREQTEACQTEVPEYIHPEPSFDVIHGSGWHMMDDGLTERRVDIGEKAAKAEFYYRVQISYRGGDSGDYETWHGPYPSLDAAIAAADASDTADCARAEETAQSREDEAIRSFEQRQAGV